MESMGGPAWLSVSTPYLRPRQEGEPEVWAQEAAAHGRTGTQHLREVGVVEAPADVAAAFGLEPGEGCIARKRLIMLDGRVVELADSYCPVAVAAGTGLADPRKIPGGAPTLLGKLGYRAQHVREDVSARLTTEVEQALLRLTAPAAVLRNRIMRYDGEPVELSWSYYPVEIAVGSPLAQAQRIPGGAPSALAQLGHPQRRFVDRLSVRPPTSEEVQALELPDDVPVIRQFRIIFSDADRPVEVSVMIKGGHRYELTYNHTIN